VTESYDIKKKEKKTKKGERKRGYDFAAPRSLGENFCGDSSLPQTLDGK